MAVFADAFILLDDGDLVVFAGHVENSVFGLAIAFFNSALGRTTISVYIVSIITFRVNIASTRNAYTSPFGLPC